MIPASWIINFKKRVFFHCGWSHFFSHSLSNVSVAILLKLLISCRYSKVNTNSLQCPKGNRYLLLGCQLWSCPSFPILLQLYKDDNSLLEYLNLKLQQWSEESRHWIYFFASSAACVQNSQKVPSKLWGIISYIFTLAQKSKSEFQSVQTPSCWWREHSNLFLLRVLKNFLVHIK